MKSNMITITNNVPLTADDMDEDGGDFDTKKKQGDDLTETEEFGPESTEDDAEGGEIYQEPGFPPDEFSE